MTLKKRQKGDGTREEEKRSSWCSKRQYSGFQISGFGGEWRRERCRAGQKQKASGNAAPEQIAKDGFGRIGGF